MSSDYYVLTGGPSDEDEMALYPIPDPSGSDRWWKGAMFKTLPSTPIVLHPRDRNEMRRPLDFYHAVPVMSEMFYKALIATGVDNVDVYPAVIASGKDRSTMLPGFYAYNIIGLVSAADPDRTKFNPDNPSRLVDASIESLAIDPGATHNFLMFRLAESVDAILIHGRIKRELEKQPFTGMEFHEASGFATL